MLCDGYTSTYDLSAGDLVRLENAQGTTLRVTRGSLWLTQDHDTRDIVLTPGDVWTVDRNGLTLAEAQDDLTLCLLGESSAALVRGPRLDWLDRLAAWVDATGLPLGRRSAPYF